jgi:hypothetical protein
MWTAARAAASAQGARAAVDLWFDGLRRAVGAGSAVWGGPASF